MSLFLRMSSDVSGDSGMVMAATHRLWQALDGAAGNPASVGSSRLIAPSRSIHCAVETRPGRRESADRRSSLAFFRDLDCRRFRRGKTTPFRHPGWRSASEVPAFGDDAQQRKGSGAALQAAASRSLCCARWKPALAPLTTNDSNVPANSAGRRDSREARRNSRWASRSLSAASLPSSSPGNSVSPSSEELPARQRFCNWRAACQPVAGNNIPRSANAGASHNRLARRVRLTRCGVGRNIGIPVDERIFHLDRQKNDPILRGTGSLTRRNRE